MSDGSTAFNRKPMGWASPRLKAFLMVTALVLVVGTAAPQPLKGGGRPYKGPLSPDANGSKWPGQAVEFTMLLREHSRRPFAAHSVSPAMRYQLGKAHDIAISALRREPGCRTLFQRLGADGEAVLARSQYFGADDSRYCQDGVSAFTNVGSAQIKLCGRFGTLQASGAALLLLHEALHSSGLRESPTYPNALTANEINVVVSQGCNLR